MKSEIQRAPAFRPREAEAGTAWLRPWPEESASHRIPDGSGTFRCCFHGAPQTTSSRSQSSFTGRIALGAAEDAFAALAILRADCSGSDHPPERWKAHEAQAEQQASPAGSVRNGAVKSQLEPLVASGSTPAAPSFRLIQDKRNETGLPFSLSFQTPMGGTKSLPQPEHSTVSTATVGG